MMEENNELVQAALATRDRFLRKLRERETPEQRLERFRELQNAAWEILRSSPEGYQAFLRRNYRKRRVEVINGEWRLRSTEGSHRS